MVRRYAVCRRTGVQTFVRLARPIRRKAASPFAERRALRKTMQTGCILIAQGRRAWTEDTSRR